MPIRYRTEEYKAKRRKMSEETRRKIGDAQRGERNHMWGKRQSVESNVKRSESLKGKAKRIGHGKKVGDAQRRIPRPNMSGENHPNWKGGWTQEKIAGRSKPEICELCGGGGRICFDHDHTTGQFRGWICSTCNTALGHARDSTELLYKMINYLESSRTTQNASLSNVPIQ